MYIYSTCATSWVATPLYICLTGRSARTERQRTILCPYAGVCTRIAHGLRVCVPLQGSYIYLSVIDCGQEELHSQTRPPLQSFTHIYFGPHPAAPPRMPRSVATWRVIQQGDEIYCTVPNQLVHRTRDTAEEVIVHCCGI